MTTFVALDGSTVAPITRADLMKHPAFHQYWDGPENPDKQDRLYLGPSVFRVTVNCPNCGLRTTRDDRDLILNECGYCGESGVSETRNWDVDGHPEGSDAHRLWLSLPEVGSDQAEEALYGEEDAAMADHDAHVERRETATILAALRFWQRQVHRGPSTFACYAESEIATDGGTLEPMTAAEIDDLCERLNCAPLRF